VPREAVSTERGRLAVLDRWIIFATVRKLGEGGGGVKWFVGEPGQKGGELSGTAYAS